MPRIRKNYKCAYDALLKTNYKIAEIPKPFRFGQKIIHYANGEGFVLAGHAELKSKLIAYFPNSTLLGKMTNLKGVFSIHAKYLLEESWSIQG